MRKKRFLVLCSVLLAISIALVACSTSAVNYGAAIPAPAAAADSPDFFMERGEIGFAAQSTTARFTDDVAWAYDMAVEEEAAIFFAGSGAIEMNMRQAAPADRMIATTFSIDAETMDFENSENFIISAVHEVGGYIENRSVRGRSIRDFAHNERFASFTVRIPSGVIHEFVAVVGENTNIVSTSEHSEDITDMYFDSQARLASLINQESLLNALLENEGADLQYILEVHRELASVRHQIESLYSNIQRMEQRVNFSTAHINLHEVMQYTPVEELPTTFGQRMSQATSNSWNNFVRQTQNAVINMIGQLPFFIANLLWIALLVVVFLIVRRVIRKKKGKKRGESTFEWLDIGRLNIRASSKKGEGSEASDTENDGE